MKLFGQLVRTVVNVVELPLAVGKDALTLGGALTDREKSHTRELAERIKEEAAEQEDD